ncbi:FYVE zinc finger [Seminavis robusta]|uniref:FYVE zinc finger n=1 Tax=Seminavis robusta TaxID=568900 RepID=A0A9N8HTR4_9STRA|nr:FYVE zinc finger [Seminavis robusta]|eukprot:Sro1926_g305930.1 FYVE zinc finger (330) ;mRNA; r:17910-18987
MTWTLLHSACEHLDAKSIYDRCKLGTNEPLEHDDHGSTPLHILAWGNPDPQLLQALVASCPVAVSDKDVHGDTALHVACSFPETTVKVVKVLLDACPTSVSMTNKEGLMPLHMACRFAPNNEAVIGYLIDAYPCALRSRIKMGSPAPFRKRTSLRNKPGDHFVSREVGATDFVEARFRTITAQVRDGAYPLHMAIKAGAPTSVLEMMLKEADDVMYMMDKFGQTPLHVAMATQAEDGVIEMLVENGGMKAVLAKDKSENLPIHLAAIHGCSVRAAKGLLQKCLPSIHEKNAAGLTIMDLALESGKCGEDVLRLFEITKDETQEEDEKKE